MKKYYIRDVFKLLKTDAYYAEQFIKDISVFKLTMVIDFGYDHFIEYPIFRTEHVRNNEYVFKIDQANGRYISKNYNYTPGIYLYDDSDNDIIISEFIKVIEKHSDIDKDSILLLLQINELNITT